MYMYVVKVPLRVLVTKVKWFTFNLNYYRNTHYQVTNKAKKLYKEDVTDQIMSLPRFAKIHIEFRLYPKTKRLCDLDNILSIHAKFFLDSLVSCGKLLDDTYINAPMIDFRFGEIDKENPRVEVTIKVLEND